MIADHLSRPNQSITTEWSLHSEISIAFSRVGGSPSVFSIPLRPAVTTGSVIQLGWKVIPSACMEALMQHYKAAGFSDEVSRLAAAPKRPSTNFTYEDRCLRFNNWATGQGFESSFCTFFLTLMVYHLKLLKAKGTVWPRCLTGRAMLKWFSTRLSPI